MDTFVANEIAKRYNGTHAYVRVNNKEMAVRFRDFNIHEDDEAPQTTAIVELLTANRKATTTIEIDMDDMQIHHIKHNSLFNFGNSFFYYARRPVRQFRKGYYSENTTLFDVVVTDMTNANVHVSNDDNGITILSVEAFHNPDFANFYEDAINRIVAEQRIGIAVNSSFGVGLSFIKGYDYILYFKHKPIAHITGEKVTVNSMRQEVVDFFKYFSRGGYVIS